MYYPAIKYFAYLQEHFRNVQTIRFFVRCSYLLLNAGSVSFIAFRN